MSFKKRLKCLVEDNGSRSGRLFDLIIQILILLSVVGFMLETLPDLTEGQLRALRAFHVLSIVLFTIEYLLRIWVADSKRQFIFSFYGLIDLAAILPFFLMARFDLRGVRILRLFRLLRTLKILRYSKAARRIRLALSSIREELILFFFSTLFLFFLASIGIYYFEHNAQPEVFQSIFHCFWWAIISLTTVGYGDMVPMTTGGRIFSFFVLMLGLGVIAVPSGLVASAMTKVVRDEREKRNGTGIETTQD